MTLGTRGFLSRQDDEGEDDDDDDEDEGEGSSGAHVAVGETTTADVVTDDDRAV